MKTRSKKLPKLKSITTYNEYDFLDLGAGDGGSLASVAKSMGGKGLGIELLERKVQKAVEQGHNVVLGDALKLDTIPGKVNYTVCDNFLEHLPDRQAVEAALQKAAAVTRQFIYIRHPSFEDNDYLRRKGLKTYWSHWRGHTSMLTLSDIVEIFHAVGIDVVQIYPVGRILDSNDPAILPEKAPIDQHEYEPSHGPKPKRKITFDRHIYHAYDIIGMIPGKNSCMPILEYTGRHETKKRPASSQNYRFKGAGQSWRDPASYPLRKLRLIRDRRLS